MRSKNKLLCERVRWHGRDAYRLCNGLIELITLTGGGQIAVFHFDKATGFPDLSPLWIPPWQTIEPYRYREGVHGSKYGKTIEGKLLSGIAGHNICLDYFGSPSSEETRYGLSQHGEAASARWRRTATHIGKHVALTLSVTLPIAGLRFSREISIYPHESVAYFAETVVNEKRCDHFFHWTQHVTIGPPFLSRQDTVISIPANKGITFPHEYDEGKTLLNPGKPFHWPDVPAKQKPKTYDLRHVLLERGLGFVAAVLIDRRRNLGFVAAHNHQYHILLCYCFSREDFPWVTLWEENQAIQAVPWKKRTEARGLEFGTTPLALPRREAFAQGTLFGTPTFTYVPARGRKTVRYLAFLARVPDEFREVEDVYTNDREILVSGGSELDAVRLSASRASVILESQNR